MDNDDDTSDTELDDFDPFKEYRLFNEPKPLARGLNISLENSLILHLSFAKRHNLTKAALQDLLHLTNLHLVQPNDFPLTLDKLYSGIGLSTIGVSKKYYCKNCFELLCENDDQCPSCNFVGKDFFIYNSIEEQLKRQLQKTRFKENLIDPRTRDSNSTVIKDVYDGKFYKDLIKDGYFENDGINLTCQLNTDGVSLFRSSTFSVWPVYLRINELPPLLRKSKEFKILPGLWFGKKKPYMRTFLRPIVDAMKNLCRGLDLELDDGSNKTVRMVISGGLFDLPAKCLAQEMIQYNGYFGCSFCELKGERVQCTGKKKGSKTVFPMIKSKDLVLRSEERTMAQALLAIENNKTVFGIRGFSILGELPHLNIIWNFPFDYMHGVFLGVAKSLASLWFDSANSKHPWYLGRVSKTIDKKLVAIEPPDEISRLPRSIIDHRGYYKANEYRNWFFFFAPVILQNILPEPYYSHFLLLVHGIFILQKEEILTMDLNFAEQLLFKFVRKMDEVYDKAACKANVHNVVHYPEQVRWNGPLWASMSGFTYENWNGEFKYLFHGTQHVDQQIVTSVNVRLRIPEIARSLTEGSLEWHFYHKLMSSGFESKKFCYGPFKTLKSLEDGCDRRNLIVQTDTIARFERICINNTMFKSEGYTRTTRRCNFAVYAEVDNVLVPAIIKYFIQVNQGDRNLAVLNILKDSGKSICGQVDELKFKVTHIKCLERTNKNILVDVTAIRKKQVLIAVDDLVYFADFVNPYESD